MTSDPAPEGNAYRQVLTSIVKRFVRLVGASAAVVVARRVPQLKVEDDGNVTDYDQENPVDSVMRLIVEYGAVFGEMAVTLSRQATRPMTDSAAQSVLQEAGLLNPAASGPLSVLLVDDHSLFREGIASLLSSQPDIKVVGQAGSVREAVAKAQNLKPDVVLMDLGLPDGSGLEATRAILASQPAAKIVILTVHENDEQLFAAVRAGAVGYLFKNIRAGELLKRLRDVAQGDAGLSPAIARRILDEFSRLPSPPAAPNSATDLTARELEIVRELAHAATNREIAQKFVISENTVKNHVRNVLSKLHLHSRRDLASYARDHGLTPPPEPPK